MEGEYFDIKNNENLAFGVCKTHPTILDGKQSNLPSEIIFSVQSNEDTEYNLNNDEVLMITLSLNEARKLALRIMSMI